MPDPFDPNSSGAMFATILEKLEHIKETGEATKAEAIKTNSRVTALEQWKAVSQTKTGIIAAGVTTLFSIAIWFAKTFVT